MWYFQKKGRTEGPIPEATLHLAIQKGEIGALDLLFREGDSRWRAAGEFDTLQRFFSQRTGSAHEDHWIVLSRTKGNADNKQRGPYRTSEVKMKLRLGEIKYTDYVWKQGMKEWYRITALEIFHGEARPIAKEEIVPPVPPPPAKNEDLLKNVKVLERPPIPKAEERPPEADGPDLTMTAVTIVQPVPDEPAKKTRSSRGKASVVKKAAPVSSQRLTMWMRFQEASPSTKWLVGTACVILSLLIAFGSLFFSSYKDHQDLLARVAPKSQGSKTAVLEPVAAPEMVAPPQTEPLPAEPEKPRIEPSYLKIKVTGEGSEAPIVELQTNASFHFPIKMTLIGDIGEVIGVRSYYRQIVVAEIEKRKYELRNLGLKPGRYHIVANLGTFEAKGAVSVATNTKTFRSDLAAHRKQISYYATNERIQLIKLSERLTDHNKDFIEQFRTAASDSAQLRSLLKKWQKKLETISSQTLKSINSRTRSQYVYGEYWIDLKDLRSNMLKDSSKAVQAKDIGTPAWQAYMNDVQSVKALKEKMLSASLWK